MNNKVFKEIIRHEIDMMFGGKKPKKNVLPTIHAVEPSFRTRAISERQLIRVDEESTLNMNSCY